MNKPCLQFIQRVVSVIMRNESTNSTARQNEQAHKFSKQKLLP
jgi:hypothetical protein